MIKIIYGAKYAILIFTYVLTLSISLVNHVM